jgi:hypothetical protein
MEFQLSLTSTIVDASTIRVRISSSVNLISVNNVRIDTVVIDRTQITFSKLVKLDIQTADCPTSPYSINFAYPAYSENYQNMIPGLSSFFLQNKAKFKL